MWQIVFGVGQPEDILAEQSGIAGVAAADGKVDMRKRLAGDGELLGGGDPKRRIATNPLEPCTGEWADRQAEFLRIGLGDGAEECPAIEDEAGVASVDLRRDDRPATGHRHRNFDISDDLALAGGPGRQRSQKEREQTQTCTDPPSQSPPPEPIIKIRRAAISNRVSP